MTPLSKADNEFVLTLPESYRIIQNQIIVYFSKCMKSAIEKSDGKDKKKQSKGISNT